MKIFLSLCIFFGFLMLRIFVVEGCVYCFFVRVFLFFLVVFVVLSVDIGWCYVFIVFILDFLGGFVVLWGRVGKVVGLYCLFLGVVGIGLG